MLKNKVAIVTGASLGIGYATAKLFLEYGANVAICGSNTERIEKAAKELEALGTVRPFTVNIKNKEQCEAMVSAVMAEFGKIDILVNNAGITSDAQFYKMTDEQWDKVIDVNLNGTYYMSKAVINHMIEKKYGRIIHCTSVSAYNGNFGQSNYAASKAAIMGLTRVMGKELGKYNITVNAVAPGSILTDMYNAVPEEAKQKKLAGIPLRRYGDPSEAAELLAFLASDKAGYITTQTITIDGGFN